MSATDGATPEAEHDLGKVGWRRAACKEQTSVTRKERQLQGTGVRQCPKLADTEPSGHGRSRA